MPDRRTFAVLWPAVLLAGCALPPAGGITEDELRAHVRWLADDARAGRGTGTSEERQVAAWLARQLAVAGLQPAGEGGSWYQEFEVVLPPQPGECALSTGPEKWASARPVAASATGSVRAPLIVAGYAEGGGTGAAALRGKIALVRRFGPAAAGTVPEEAVGDLRRKARAAEEAGAVAVLLGTHPDDVARGGAGEIGFGDVPGVLGIPVLAVSPEHFAALELHAAHGAEAALQAKVVRPTTVSRNVLGLIPGTTSELVVVGAHYDHLGWGGEGSLAPGVRAIHNGADDNASGTAMLLELAEEWSQKPERAGRGLVVAFWAAEEMGLLGSQWWVNHPTVPLGDVVANVNLDMVGRLESGRVTVGEVEDAAALKPALARAQERMRAAGLRLELVAAGGKLPGGGGSDHMSFQQKRIPAAFFFSGLHADYHRPGDDWEKITFAPMRELACGVSFFLEELAAVPRADLAWSAPAADPLAVGKAEPGRARGNGAWFGSMPDYAAAPEGGGMQIAGTSPGSPAEKSGLRAGDVIRKVGEHPIGDIYAFMDALGRFQTGDTVTVEFLRDGATMTVPLTFIPRPGAGG
jgi:hypothetical protein